MSLLEFQKFQESLKKRLSESYIDVCSPTVLPTVDLSGLIYLARSPNCFTFHGAQFVTHVVVDLQATKSARLIDNITWDQLTLMELQEEKILRLKLEIPDLSTYQALCFEGKAEVTYYCRSDRLIQKPLADGRPYLIPPRSLYGLPKETRPLQY